jgi:hypothetical protein
MVLVTWPVALRIEHIHINIQSHRVDVTLFVLTADQAEADVAALLVGARLCVDLPGWLPVA